MALLTSAAGPAGVSRLLGLFRDPLLRGRDIRRIVGEAARFEPRAAPGDLKVVTWNIAYGICFERILDTVRRLDADVYLLQEVDRFCRRSGRRDVAKALADAAGMNWLFAGEFQEVGEATGACPALTGQAILSRYPITDGRVVRFQAQAWSRWHLNPVQPRRGARMALEASTAGLRVCNAHLESGDNQRLRRHQVADILASVTADGAAATPAVLAGDFNNRRVERALLLASLQRARFTDALASTPGDDRVTCIARAYPIDWIFVRRLQPSAGGVITIDHASDHYPIAVTLRQTE